MLRQADAALQRSDMQHDHRQVVAGAARPGTGGFHQQYGGFLGGMLHRTSPSSLSEK